MTHSRSRSWPVAESGQNLFRLSRASSTRGTQDPHDTATIAGTALRLLWVSIPASQAIQKHSDLKGQAGMISRDPRGGQDGAAQFLLGRRSWSRIRWSLGLSPTGKLRGPTYCPGGDKPQPTPRDAAVKMPASGVGRPAESCDTCPATYSPGASDYPLKLGTGLNGDPPGDIQWAHTGQWANCSCRHSCQLFGWASEVSSKART